MARYNSHDNESLITEGAAGLQYAGVVQAEDKFGGYNVAFACTTPGHGLYHIHFHGGGTRISVIRYKKSTTDQGRNIIICNDKPTFSDLIYECAHFPNHTLLLQNFRNAIAATPRNARNELQ